MNKDETLSHQEHRKQLWANAWSHVASAANCNSYNTATKWADEALKAFDERFPMPKEQINEPAIGLMPSKDEAVDVGYRKATVEGYILRKVFKDLGHDTYYSGWLDCYDWLSSNDK